MLQEAARCGTGVTELRRGNEGNEARNELILRRMDEMWQLKEKLELNKRLETLT
jgi:hypothetical protein